MSTTVTAKARKVQEREEAAARLRELLPPGSTVYTILRHVSRSGMSRRIDVVGFTPGEASPDWLSGLAARAMGENLNRWDSITVGGCGMDMGYHLIYNLSHTLYPDGFGCIGEKCPSNDHSNGDRDFSRHSKRRPHWHRSGGYALRHRWL